MRHREIGPVGTASRAIAGIIAITLPVALEGIGWWDVPAVVGMAAVATVAAWVIGLVSDRAAPGLLTTRHALCSPAGCALIGVVVAAAFALGEATTVHGDVAVWGFIGASMLLGALRGEAGCEVLAVPNAITGRTDRIGCLLFTPIDAAEARASAGRREPHPVR